MSTKNKVGLVICAILGLGDLTNLLVLPGNFSSGSNGPPTAVLIADVVLGVITLVAVWFAWRNGNRAAARMVAGSRILSAITALPAFFVGGVAAGLVLLAATGIVLTVVGVWLTLAPARQPVPA